MTKRAIGFLVLYFSCGLVAFVFPAAGVWGFVFESNYSPPLNAWWGGPLMVLGDRWSLFIGAIMILATLLHWEANPRARLFSHPQTILLMLFTLNCCLVTLWAHDINESWKETVANLKWLAVYFCIIKTHSDRRWLPVILYIYLLGVIDAGWMTTFEPKSGRFGRGGPMSVVSDRENFLSPHAVAFLPLVGVYAISREVPIWIRGACILGAPLMLNIVANGQSRGAFLALLATGGAMLVLSRGVIRGLTIIGLIIGALLCARLFHEQFWNRMSTIETYQQDGSATHRIDAWKDAWQLTLKQPMGNGGEAFDHGLRTVTITTHSMYFECLVAWGFQGTFFWFAYIFVSCRDAWKLTGQSFRRGQKMQSLEYLESLAILVGLISMLASAVFVNRMRWELWWMFPAYVVCLKNIHVSGPAQDSRHQRYLLIPQPFIPQVHSVSPSMAAAATVHDRP